MLQSQQMAIDSNCKVMLANKKQRQNIISGSGSLHVCLGT